MRLCALVVALLTVATLAPAAAAQRPREYAVFEVAGRLAHRFEAFEYDNVGNLRRVGCFLDIRVAGDPYLKTVLVRSVEQLPCSALYPRNRRVWVAGRIELFLEVNSLVYF